MLRDKFYVCQLTIYLVFYVILFLQIKIEVMKKSVFLFLFLLYSINLIAQELNPISLTLPRMDRGLPVMKALLLRSSIREYSDKKLKVEDLSDLLWAANGINRPESGLRTAPSAMNAQDIDIYVFLEEGIYLHDAKNHKLLPVKTGDYRTATGTQEFAGTAPVGLILVSDISRFESGDAFERVKYAAMDAGIVSQNISIYCASVGLATVPRAGIDMGKVKELLRLTDSQYIMLNHPVGLPK